MVKLYLHYSVPQVPQIQLPGSQKAVKLQRLTTLILTLFIFYHIWSFYKGAEKACCRGILSVCDPSS